MSKKWPRLVFVAALLAMLPSARADWPPHENPDGSGVDYSDPANWPNDPGYAGAWNLWSFVPKAWQSHVTAENNKLGTGAHVDRAWAKTIGDRRIVIAEVDSGCEWDNADLVNKWYLNAGELPAPKGCPGSDGTRHDVNGDGVFNVQDYTTATGHQLPAFTMVCDARITKDVNGNGLLDPEDLIAAFSDGKDDDQNGYVDDISGWDFFRNDNDPQDDTHYGHGNGSQRDSAAEGNNGMGDIGTCPGCSIMSLRFGDTYMTEGAVLGMAVLFAVDSGATLIEGEGATIDNAPLVQQAFDYAYRNGVAVTYDSSDLNSYHHNFPDTLNHDIVVHAITYDSQNPSDATTFLNFNNCSNYGAQVPVSMPGSACASEAVAKFAGVVGLVQSAALAADIPPAGDFIGDPNHVRRLSTEEVYQVLLQGMDDLYDPADATDPDKFPTRVGWDLRFGYGRTNARNSVDMVLKGRIPPAVAIDSPSWFPVIDPSKTPKVTVTGTVSFRNQPGNKYGDSVDWVLEWAPGIWPLETDFKPIAQASQMTSSIVSDKIADWDVSGLDIENPDMDPPDGHAHKYMVTLRLRATVHSSDPSHDGVKGEARKALYIKKDATVVDGFPITLGASGESSPKLVDIDGDGKREVIVADAAGYVHAFKPGGKEAAGWPVRTKLVPSTDPATTRGAPHLGESAFGAGKISSDVHSSVTATVAIGDIDGDKKPEVFVADFDGNLYAFHGDGTLAKGWPEEVDRSVMAERAKKLFPAGVDDGVFAAPAMADFDGDGVNEIVVADMLGEVTVWKGDGTKLPGWPVRAWDTSLPDDGTRQLNRILSSPALGDLNGDGTPDIVVGSNEDYDNNGRLYAIDGKTGKFLPGFPITIVSTFILPMVGSGIPNAPALADLDGDHIPEILIGTIGNATRMFDHSGKPFHRIFVNTRNEYGALSDAHDDNTFSLIANPAFGDLDDDGFLDAVMPTVGEGALLAMAGSGVRHSLEMHLSAWDTRDGKFKPGFPRVLEDYPIFNNPVVADVDGDGHSEAVVGSAAGFLHAWRADGSEASGFPKFTGGWVAEAPAVGDLDGDGKLELVVGTRDGILWAWHVGGTDKGRIDWPSFHHDLANTGNFDTPLDEGVSHYVPPADMGTGGGGSSSGCGCSVGRAGSLGGGALAVILVTLALALAARRRKNAC